MRRASRLISVASCALAAAVACGREVSGPTTPGGAQPATPRVTVDANPDGSTLKATAPSPQSPVNSTGVSPGRPVVLVLANAKPLYAVDVLFSYRFEVTNAAGTIVDTGVATSGPATTSRTVPIELQAGQTFRWRARAEYQSAFGPWSDQLSFIAQPPLLTQTTFLAFGDSITSGTIDSPCSRFLIPGLATFQADTRLLSTAVNVATAYPTVLQSLLASRYTAQSVAVTNEGRPGELASEAFSRLRAVLNSVSPQVLLLEEGINDINSLDDSDIIPSVINALRAMVREARGRGIQVLLATLVPERAGACRGYNPGMVAPVNDQIRALAASEGVTLVDLYQAFVGREGELLGLDGLHPNVVGYQQMAETFFNAIRTKLESPTF